MIARRISWVAAAAVSVAALTFGVVGCELIASVDRTDIPTATGGSGGTGGSTGGGGVYNQAQFGDADAEFEEWTEALAAHGSSPVTMAIEVVWSDVVARPLPFDLSVELGGVAEPLVQVFSIDEGPFARVGTQVEPLVPDTDYRIELSRTSIAAWARLVGTDGDVLVAGPVVEVDPAAADVVTLVRAKDEPRISVGENRDTRASVAK